MTKNLRKQYFIDKNFQTKFILRFCLLVITSSLVIGLAIMILSKNSTTVTIENTQVVVKSTADFIYPIIVQVLIIVTFFSALIFAAMSLFVSHKIAGPLYRIKKEIDKIAEGDLKRNFNLRASDQLQELSKSLGRMCKTLRENRKFVSSDFNQLKNYLKEKDYTVGSTDADGLIKILNQMEEKLNQIKS